MMPDAESQGLPQGFNDELVASPEEIVTRPRPESEAFDIQESIAAERAAYDRRHAPEALAERRGVDPSFVDDSRTAPPEPAKEDDGPKGFADLTNKQLGELLTEHGIAFPKKGNKATLVEIAEQHLEWDDGEDEGVARIEEINLRLAELAPEGEDEEADAEREALQEELDTLLGNGDDE